MTGFFIGLLVGIIPFVVLIWHQRYLPTVYMDNVVDVEEYLKDKVMTD